MEFNLEFIENFVENIGKMMGDRCEIVIHDFTQDLEHTIVHIVNGKVSGREMGGCPTNLFFENSNNLEKEKKRLVEYYTTTEDGRTIRSSTTLLTGANNEAIGAVCINLDITELKAANATLSHWVGNPIQSTSAVENERFSKNVQDLMNDYLQQVERKMGKPACQMKKQEKLQALAFLDERGVFQIAKAHVRLCEFFDISKYTLYNYLEEVRKNNGV